MIAKETKLTRPLMLEERIQRIRTEINAIIDAKAAAAARANPGVPLGVIRNLLTAHAPACPCTQYLELNAAGERAGTAGRSVQTQADD